MNNQEHVLRKAILDLARINVEISNGSMKESALYDLEGLVDDLSMFLWSRLHVGQSREEALEFVAHLKMNRARQALSLSPSTNQGKEHLEPGNRSRFSQIEDAAEIAVRRHCFKHLN